MFVFKLNLVCLGPFYSAAISRPLSEINLFRFRLIIFFFLFLFFSFFLFFARGWGLGWHVTSCSLEREIWLIRLVSKNCNGEGGGGGGGGAGMRDFSATRFQNKSYWLFLFIL